MERTVRSAITIPVRMIEKGKVMLEVVKQAMLAGVGALVLTKEAVEKATQKLVDEGKMSAEDAEKLARELVKEAESSGRKLQDKSSDLFQKALRSMNLVPRAEFEELKARVEALERLKPPSNIEE